MDSERTGRWYLTRIEFAIAVGAILLTVAAALLSLSAPPGPPGPMWVSWPILFGIGAALSLIGFVWMIRIYRGPLDEPPPWRYRDR